MIVLMLLSMDVCCSIYHEREARLCYGQLLPTWLALTQFPTHEFSWNLAIYFDVGQKYLGFLGNKYLTRRSRDPSVMVCRQIQIFSHSAAGKKLQYGNRDLCSFIA